MKICDHLCSSNFFDIKRHGNHKYLTNITIIYSKDSFLVQVIDYFVINALLEFF